MKAAVAVTTAPRHVATVVDTVISLQEAGWEPTVFAEPGSAEVDCTTVWNTKRRGLWHNWLHSCQEALKTNPDYVLCVQDDCEFHPDSRSFLEEIAWPATDVGFVSLYTPKHYSFVKSNPRKRGVNKIHTTSLWGALALAFPAEVLEKVINHTIAECWYGSNGRPKPEHEVCNSDTAIGLIVNNLKRSMWFIDPSPVRHTARYSTIKSHADNTGKRNCYRCADHKLLLKQQVPWNGVAYTLTGPKPTGNTLYDDIRQDLYSHGFNAGFAIPIDEFEAIQETVKPHHYTLEFGAGVSTYAFKKSKYHYAIDQSQVVTTHFDTAHHHKLKGGWYTNIPQNPTELDHWSVILLDGPYEGDRRKGLPFLIDQLKKGAIVFVDDIQRDDESSIVETLSQQFVVEEHGDVRKWAKCYRKKT